MSLFLTRLRSVLDENGKTQKEICADLGIRNQKLSNWKTGYSEPNFDDLLMLASYFNVSVDYLLGLTDSDDTPSLNSAFSSALTTEEYELLKSYRLLSTKGKARVIAYTDLLCENEKSGNPL